MSGEIYFFRLTKVRTYRGLQLWGLNFTLKCFQSTMGQKDRYPSRISTTMACVELPKCIQFICFSVNQCGNDNIFMKIPNPLIWRIEFKFSPKTVYFGGLCANAL